MTNPADVLTDEFIARVAESIACRSSAFGLRYSPPRLDNSNADRDAIKAAAASVLREEREPIQTLVFEVRAETHQAAVDKFAAAANQRDGLWCRSDIRLKDDQ